MNVRKAQVGDATAIRAVQVASIRGLCSRDYTPEQIEHWLRKPLAAYFKAIQSKVVLVAESGAGVVGFGQIDLSAGLIQALYVHPDHARKGVGTLLLTSLEREAWSGQVPQLVLCSTLNAVGFYRSQDYIEIGPETTPLADGTSLPRVRMKKVLFTKLESANHQPMAERVLASLRCDDAMRRRSAR